MILALDSDVLIHLNLAGAEHHESVHRTLREHLSVAGGRVGLVPHVLHEFLHVATDGRRFEHPLTMKDAVGRVRELWHANDTVRLDSHPGVLARTLELLETHRLGRKRILDTTLAATLEAAGVRRLFTLNPADFRIFSFLELVALST